MNADAHLLITFSCTDLCSFQREWERETKKTSTEERTLEAESSDSNSDDVQFKGYKCLVVLQTLFIYEYE